MDEENKEPQDEEIKSIEEIINGALNFKPEQLQAFREQKDLRDKLRSIVSEYLDSFYIFGYDIDGNTVLIKGASSDMQMDALDTLAMRLFIAGNLGGTYGQGPKY